MSPELELATIAAREAGALLRENFGCDHEVDKMLTHDIKLALDVKSQDLIEKRILETFPEHAIYGEEGVAGNRESDTEWIVDPIDGTVNFFFGIPHFCISIAMRQAGELKIGAIYDPMLDEMFTVDFEGPATRNGEPIRPSNRAELSEAVVTIGFSKNKESIDAGIEKYKKFAHRVRKTRMMGSAALALAYIACGRLDVYVEEMISIWDIAAGQLMLERGGGKVELSQSGIHSDRSGILSHNGKLNFDGLV
ncbi:MAG: inositol monophosphatase family protein [Verrucomicrobiales bacterium]|jgi:myo-inositol-1(or 4)-monophosphatase|nr:inositol monophosphatase [Verrucomicrobiales bacterium]MDB3940553.1 inositol monophosphatase [Verrucomicrobiales bacterium]